MSWPGNPLWRARGIFFFSGGVIPQRGLAQLADFLLQSGDLLVTLFDFRLLHSVPL